jgi:hypothetical protein
MACSPHLLYILCTLIHLFFESFLVVQSHSAHCSETWHRPEMPITSCKHLKAKKHQSTGTGNKSTDLRGFQVIRILSFVSELVNSHLVGRTERRCCAHRGLPLMLEHPRLKFLQPYELLIGPITLTKSASPPPSLHHHARHNDAYAATSDSPW